MKFGTIVIATLIALSVLFATRSTAAGPLLKLPEAEFDFGYVPQGSKVTHVFWLYSVGTDTLKIIRVNPG